MSSDIEFAYKVLSKMMKVDSAQVPDLQMVEYKKSSSLTDDLVDVSKKNTFSGEKRKKESGHRNRKKEVFFNFCCFISFISYFTVFFFDQ